LITLYDLPVIIINIITLMFYNYFLLLMSHRVVANEVLTS